MCLIGIFIIFSTIFSKKKVTTVCGDLTNCKNLFHLLKLYEQNNDEVFIYSSKILTKIKIYFKKLK